MILAIDQGTTGTTCLVVDDELSVLGRGYRELEQHFPEPGWVEHDADEIWLGVLQAAARCARRRRHHGARARLDRDRQPARDDRRLGAGHGPAGGAGDRLAGPADRCALPYPRLRASCANGPASYPTRTSRRRSSSGCSAAGRQAGLAFGTIDSWLVWQLTRRSRCMSATGRTRRERSSARSRRSTGTTSCCRCSASIESFCRRSSGPTPTSARRELFGAHVPIRGLAGDQQAALYGHGCHTAGEGKVTYGTGSFVLVHSGAQPPPPPHGLLATAAADGYALEGAVLVSGAALQWLRDGLGVLGSAAESELLARSVDSTGGVVFVPGAHGARLALVGPGRARARDGASPAGRRERSSCGRPSRRSRTRWPMSSRRCPLRPTSLRADGGASANGFLMQHQSDLLGIPVEVAADLETTALGAAALASRNAGRESAPAPATSRSCPPTRSRCRRQAWNDAVNRTRS